MKAAKPGAKERGKDQEPNQAGTRNKGQNSKQSGQKSKNARSTNEERQRLQYAKLYFVGCY